MDLVASHHGGSVGGGVCSGVVVVVGRKVDGQRRKASQKHTRTVAGTQNRLVGNGSLGRFVEGFLAELNLSFNEPGAGLISAAMIKPL